MDLSRKERDLIVVALRCAAHQSRQGGYNDQADQFSDLADKLEVYINQCPNARLELLFPPPMPWVPQPPKPHACATPYIKWTYDDTVQCYKEGWSLFHNDDDTYGIQKLHDLEYYADAFNFVFTGANFASEDEALAFVKEQANKGSDRHIRALQLCRHMKYPLLSDPMEQQQWTRDDSVACYKEGWGPFHQNDGSIRIEKLGDTKWYCDKYNFVFTGHYFKSDDEALTFVKDQAKKGSDLHKRALKLCEKAFLYAPRPNKE
jgi:hypothetical protein